MPPTRGRRLRLNLRHRGRDECQRHIPHGLLPLPQMFGQEARVDISSPKRLVGQHILQEKLVADKAK